MDQMEFAAKFNEEALTEDEQIIVAQLRCAYRATSDTLDGVQYLRLTKADGYEHMVLLANDLLQ